MKSKFMPHIALVVLLALVLAPPVYAYLDPGTGSYIVQLLIGGLLGGLFAVGLMWRRIIGWLKRLFSGNRGNDRPIN
jgi:hypothetical protein